MMRDIDYATLAVRKRIEEKFAATDDMNKLQVTAGERTIRVQYADQSTTGTRDALLVKLRTAATLSDFMEASRSSRPVSR